MASDLVSGIGNSLLGSYNAPGTSSANPIFTYPGSSSAAPTSAKPYTPDTSAYDALLKQYLASQAPVAAPTAYSFDTSAAQARARSAAEGNVNPLYTKALNDFITNQKVQTERQKTDTATANQRLQEALSNSLQTIGTTRERTAEDTTNNINNINTQSDQFQADTGQAFDTARNQQAATQAQSGLLGSGLGAGQTAAAQTSRNTAEGRQATSFNVAKQQANLLKTRTFNDLATAETQANKQTGEGTAQNNLNLSRYIEDTATALENEKTSLEQSRLGAVAAQLPSYYSNELNKFYSQFNVNDPRLQATRAAYGA